MRRWFTSLALTLAATFAVAVPAASAQRGPRVADPDAAREQARQKIRALRAMIMVQELGLDEATAGKLGPVMARYDDDLAKLQADRRALRKSMHDAIAAGDDRKLDGLIDQLVANQRARWEREQARFADVRRLLTPRQAARLIDVLPQIDRRILQGLRRAVNGGGGDDELDIDDGSAPPPPQGPPRRRFRRMR
ncbi:MAG TPA: hypothetical protein VHE35_17250 [Kofleriaceae bacterium]|nr:hypothetical protein [Kofleriaceae bacterium]